MPEPAKTEQDVDPVVLDEEELRALAEDIVNYCPSLTQLLLALAGPGEPLIQNGQSLN